MSRIHRRRFVPVVLAGGALCAALLAASTTGTLSGFVATITNSTDTAASGTLTMQEQTTSGTTVTCTSTDSTTVSTNSATCSTINKYGGSTTMSPGSSVVTTITIKNTGTVAASSFTLTPGACSQSNNGSVNGSATDLCSQMTVGVTSGSSTISATKTLAAFNTAGAVTLAAVPAGTTVSYTFTVTLPSGVGNTYQGLAASQPLVWTFNS